jgi:hypothetical protein
VYSFSDQNSPSILKVTPGAPLPGITLTGLPANATEIFAQKGNLHLVQMKVVVGTGSNLRFPLAVSYSNRTELVQHPNWKAQIGVSYDFDALFCK